MGLSSIRLPDIWPRWFGMTGRSSRRGATSRIRYIPRRRRSWFWRDNPANSPARRAKPGSSICAIGSWPSRWAGSPTTRCTEAGVTRATCRRSRRRANRWRHWPSPTCRRRCLRSTLCEPAESNPGLQQFKRHWPSSPVARTSQATRPCPMRRSMTAASFSFKTTPCEIKPASPEPTARVACDMPRTAAQPPMGCGP